MPLPVGNWKINYDGFTGTLAIGTLGGPDGSGNQFFQGTTTFGTNPSDNITGFWDEGGQQVSFLRLPAAHTDYSHFNVFTGRLYSFRVQFEIIYTLAGDVGEFSLNANTAAWNLLFNVGGTATGTPLPRLWCAQQTVLIILEDK
jgi:hypothetical protein